MPIADRKPRPERKTGNRDRCQMITSSDVTCLIPTHRPSTIRQTVESILEQSIPVSRIVIVCDGGSYFYQGKHITIASNEIRAGKVEAQRKGLELIDTEYVLCVDGDTILDRDCLYHLKEHLPTSSLWRSRRRSRVLAESENRWKETATQAEL